MYIGWAKVGIIELIKTGQRTAYIQISIQSTPKSEAVLFLQDPEQIKLLLFSKAIIELFPYRVSWATRGIGRDQGTNGLLQ